MLFSESELSTLSQFDPVRCILVKLGPGERCRVHGQGHTNGGI